MSIDVEAFNVTALKVLGVLKKEESERKKKCEKEESSEYTFVVVECIIT